MNKKFKWLSSVLMGTLAMSGMVTSVVACKPASGLTVEVTKDGLSGDFFHNFKYKAGEVISFVDEDGKVYKLKALTQEDVDMVVNAGSSADDVKKVIEHLSNLLDTVDGAAATSTDKLMLYNYMMGNSDKHATSGKPIGTPVGKEVEFEIISTLGNTHGAVGVVETPTDKIDYDGKKVADWRGFFHNFNNNGATSRGYVAANAYDVLVYKKTATLKYKFKPLTETQINQLQSGRDVLLLINSMANSLDTVIETLDNVETTRKASFLDIDAMRWEMLGNDSHHNMPNTAPTTLQAGDLVESFWHEFMFKVGDTLTLIKGTAPATTTYTMGAITESFFKMVTDDSENDIRKVITAFTELLATVQVGVDATDPGTAVPATATHKTELYAWLADTAGHHGVAGDDTITGTTKKIKSFGTSFFHNFGEYFKEGDIIELTNAGVWIFNPLTKEVRDLVMNAKGSETDKVFRALIGLLKTKDGIEPTDLDKVKLYNLMSLGSTGNATDGIDNNDREEYHPGGDKFDETVVSKLP